MKEYRTKEEVLQAYKKEEYPLLKKYFDKNINEERAIYNFENKNKSTMIYEILNLPLPNGNKQILLLEMIERLKN